MKKVLVIDDEPGIAQLVSWCLDSLGLEVIQASGRDTALQRARADEIGLVLLDFDLGDEDGLDILPDLRREPGLRDVPVVAFTAHDSRRREAIDSGVASFIARPFSGSQLRETVQSLVAGSP
ncbi:MAG TPA: response regulator [Acidimicrobiales bacterium]|nr:response regulator [Acidimicrobiales bacterium]HUB71774.1 response regulator [Acidimicrobiales bacterium]